MILLFFNFVQSVRKCHFSPQFQHFKFGLFGDFSRFLYFDRPCLFGLFDLLLFLWSTLRVLPDESPIFHLGILSLTSRISSNFSLSDPHELLIAATTVYRDSGKDDIKITTLISFLNLIFIELNWLTITLN